MWSRSLYLLYLKKMIDKKLKIKIYPLWKIKFKNRLNSNLLIFAREIQKRLTYSIFFKQRLLKNRNVHLFLFENVRWRNLTKILNKLSSNILVKLSFSASWKILPFYYWRGIHYFKFESFKNVPILTKLLEFKSFQKN